MSVISDAAVSRGDLAKRLDALEARLDRMETARRAEATAVGRNGVRVHSGGSVRLEGGGSLLVQDGGDVRVVGGQIVIQDASGAETFLAGTDGLTLTGLLQVLGGGDIAVTDGRLVASDGDGEVFAVDPTVPRIFMRPELIDEVSAQVFAARIFSVSDSGTGSRTSSSYGDLTGADPGPTIANVPVTATGRALVISTAHMGAATAGSNSIIGAWMSYEISGATAAGAFDDTAAAVTNLNSPASPYNPRNRLSAIALETTLNEGLHTFKSVYRSEDPAGATFALRNLTVIAF